MKKTFNVLFILFCFATMTIVFADVEINNENKYGQEIEYSTNKDYPGEISIDGVHVYQNETEYVFTILYSNGELVKVENGENSKVKTSFFNPPSGDILKMSWLDNFDKVTENKNSIQYHVDKELFNQVDLITVFLFDIKYDNNDENISVYFEIDYIDFGGIPYVDSLVSGYEISNVGLESSLETTPSSWSQKNIEELQIEGIIRDEAFDKFSEGVTRERFVYLMVKLYEELTSKPIIIDKSISFDDSADPYVLKAATIGITNGIGNNNFGPEIILNREQMTTFLIKALSLANIDITDSEVVRKFNDDNEISEWAKEFIYTARTNGIMDGIGGNLFSPKSEATNEQALYLTHYLMKKYGSLEWLEEYDGNRLYFKFEDDLYKISLESNIIVSESNTEAKLYFNTLEDINIFINTLLLKSYNKSYIASPNPNIKGTLEEYDYKKMKVFVQNIYSGVDKTGEITTINFDNDSYIAKVVHKIDNNTSKYSNFDIVKYYNLNNERQIIETLPVKRIAEALGIEYKISFNPLWDVYIVEVLN